MGYLYFYKTDKNVYYLAAYPTLKLVFFFHGYSTVKQRVTLKILDLYLKT